MESITNDVFNIVKLENQTHQTGKKHAWNKKSFYLILQEIAKLMIFPSVKI
jgi:hypothetical protein